MKQEQKIEKILKQVEKDLEEFRKRKERKELELQQKTLKMSKEQKRKEILTLCQKTLDMSYKMLITKEIIEEIEAINDKIDSFGYGEEYDIYDLDYSYNRMQELSLYFEKELEDFKSQRAVDI